MSTANQQGNADERQRLQLAALREEIAVGIAEADRGEFVDGEEAFAEIWKRSTERKHTQR